MGTSHQSLPLLLLLPLALLGCPRELPPPAWLAASTVAGSPSEPGTSVASSGPDAPFVSCEKAPPNELIRVDQFGYRPASKKVAVLVDPVEGFNADQALEPGTRYEVRSWSDGKVLFSGAPVLWDGGATQKSSGDRGYWFDFSALTKPGDYCIVDAKRGFRSHRFQIREDVYRDVLRAAVKVFYFQRANVPKEKPFACVGDKCWLAKADNVGPGQDKHARSVRDRGNAGTARDLSGGWWDAGDTNKYVTFAQTPVHQLLTAYAERPQVFKDDFGIPESGNGVPDLLDELKVELDWLTKMQASDLGGGVLLKLGYVEQGEPPPERSYLPRYYYPQPCSTSTIAAAGMFAHAALVFRAIPKLQQFASELGERAKRAWTYFEQHPLTENCDDLSIKAGDADRSVASQEQYRVLAAIYLFGLTGEAPYADAISKGFRSLRPMQTDDWSSYEPEEGDSLLFYASLANADSAIKAAILQRKVDGIKTADYGPQGLSLDLYRAYMRDATYHWGHNMVRANVGNTNYDVVQLGGAAQLKPAEVAVFSDRAEGLLQSFHGVNALGIVYLSNMYPYGAENAVNQIFHTWFRDGDPNYDEAKRSTLGPAPGYVPGGPNHQYCEGQDPSQNGCATSRLRRQPLQKAYLDFNTGWDPQALHDRSWEITEPAIYYQAAYVKLVSKFVP